MTNFFHQLRNQSARKSLRGFVLPLTLVISIIILTISAGISIILAKQIYFSKLSRQSQVAYYAADNGLMCALMIDDQYVDSSTGIGIFQYNNLVTAQDVLDRVNEERQSRGYPIITLNSIKCATSEIFNTQATDYKTETTSMLINGEPIQMTTFSMRMDLGDGTYRCATVVVNKTFTYRQIISRGFASCENVGILPVERAIVNMTNNIGISSAQTVFALTAGTSWEVPPGVTSVNVWSVGAGGGGAGSIANDSTSGGGGGAGGVAYRNFAVTPGTILNYSIGGVGIGATGGLNGSDGGDTQITINGLTLRGRGGGGGRYNSGVRGTGGNATGGAPDRKGGDGEGVSGNMGGGGGGGLGEMNGTANGCSGGTGGGAANVSGLFTALAALNMPTVSAGTGPGCGSGSPNAMNGSSATGFGNGGGGAGYYGGNGGDGLYGGGGGGAAGYTANNMRGGNGGAGIIIISTE